MNKKTISLFALLAILIPAQDILARVGGRSSYSGGGSRSFTSYSSQGSRGARTFEGGSYGNRRYAPVQRTITPATARPTPAGNSAARPSAASTAAPAAAAASPSFFQQYPFLSTVGAVIAGSAIGNMLFGHGGMGGGHGGGMGGGMINNGVAGGYGGGGYGGIILLILAIGGIMLFLNSRKKKAAQQEMFVQEPQTSFNGGFPIIDSNDRGVDVAYNEGENAVFEQIFTDIQYGWSDGDLARLKRYVTPEMLKYFADALNHNVSQGLENKVQDIKIIEIKIHEAWREEDAEYRTAVISWSAIDYMINLNNEKEIAEGSNSVPSTSQEAWTFVRYGEGQAKWILSAINQLA